MKYYDFMESDHIWFHFNYLTGADTSSSRYDFNNTLIYVGKQKHGSSIFNTAKRMKIYTCISLMRTHYLQETLKPTPILQINFSQPTQNLQKWCTLSWSSLVFHRRHPTSHILTPQKFVVTSEKSLKRAFTVSCITRSLKIKTLS